jgi:glutaminyl-tRNA synthetase
LGVGRARRAGGGTAVRPALRRRGPCGDDWLEHLNPASLEIIRDAWLEPSLATAEPGSRWQFERTGYFAADPCDTRPGAPVFNRTVTLRDTWARIEQRGRA